MTDQGTRSADPSFGQRPVRDGAFLVLWLVVVVLFGQVYVGSEVILSDRGG